MQRRKFLKSASLLGSAGFFHAHFPLIAGPFSTADFSAGQFPTDKKLDRRWVNGLYDRGEATVYRKTKHELNFIGMPVGGICCGTVYVGGDGRLWLWDIFNKNQIGASTKVLPIKLESFDLKEINNTEGTLYLEPLTEISALQQGFAISVSETGGNLLKRLHIDDWEEITFESTYPVATIRYSDKDFPLEITLRAFSPFIPGNASDSGLPATLQSITVKSRSPHNLKIELLGWFENRILGDTEKLPGRSVRKNSVFSQPGLKGVFLDCQVDGQLEKAPDFGNLAFALKGDHHQCLENVLDKGNSHSLAFTGLVRDSGNSPIAGIVHGFDLRPGEESQADFIISWYMPNLSLYANNNPQGVTAKDADRHFYTTRFKDARSVSEYISRDMKRLQSLTFQWKENWYDSTLPWWFQERTFLNISTLATTVSHRFESGRFYAMEGVGCCHGNCTHVYQYAQAMGRIFPELERDTRERVDLGIGFDDSTGMIRIRGEDTGPSIDGQAGTILRIYREHQMSGDMRFLRENWEKIRKAVRFVIEQDRNKDGMEDTPMENTLDALWHGEISWIVGLCLASVRAGQAMAEEMEDTDFAGICRHYVEMGCANMESLLFNGEYFIHRPDPEVGKKEIGSFNTCHIDQVYGQAWAWQVGLGRILSREKTLSALRALWKYNYMPDVGPYMKNHPGGRFYALAGEGGMVMNTNPLKDDNPYGNAKAWQIGYFSECMSGFEHQVAAHMMAEGMIEEALILTRSIHDRYHGFKRNPFNEIECSDHYGRAMASYGTFINACGFTYHGPRGTIGFSPKISPGHFKAPFTVARGWGSYQQQRAPHSLKASIHLRYGSLTLNRLHLELEEGCRASQVLIYAAGRKVDSAFNQTGSAIEINFNHTLHLQAGQSLVAHIH